MTKTTTVLRRPPTRRFVSSMTQLATTIHSSSATDEALTIPEDDWQCDQASRDAQAHARVQRAIRRRLGPEQEPFVLDRQTLARSMAHERTLVDRSLASRAPMDELWGGPTLPARLLKPACRTEMEVTLVARRPARFIQASLQSPHTRRAAGRPSLLARVRWALSRFFSIQPKRPAWGR